MNKKDMLPVRGGESVTAKERDRKARRRLGLSIGSYLLAYLYLAACYMVKAPEDVTVYGFAIFTLIGAASALAYGSLPRPVISPEGMEELKRMINEIK